jgi:hypothetical protein
LCTCLAKKVPKIFPTNEIARNKICSVDLLNGHEWRKVGCVVENKMMLGIDWFVVEDSSRKAKLVVSLYVVGFCLMYKIHDVHLPISMPCTSRACSLKVLPK